MMWNCGMNNLQHNTSIRAANLLQLYTRLEELYQVNHWVAAAKGACRAAISVGP